MNCVSVVMSFPFTILHQVMGDTVVNYLFYFDIFFQFLFSSFSFLYLVFIDSCLLLLFPIGSVSEILLRYELDFLCCLELPEYCQLFLYIIFNYLLFY